MITDFEKEWADLELEDSLLSDEERQKTMSKNVKYMYNGPGLSPTPDINFVAKLESGYYDISAFDGKLTFMKKNLTTDKLVRLSDTKSDQVLAEIERFWTLRDKFKKFGGLTFKRGFLLYGPPGSGKTSTVSLIVEKTIADGGVVVNAANCHTVHLIQMLRALREVEPDRRIIVTIEDIDENCGTTMLSLLDGDNNIDNVVFVATTNYPEQLPERVINRPSRFDQVVLIGMPSREARRQYLLHCDPDFGAEEIEKWLDLTDGFSVAQLKEMVISVRCFDSSPEETAKRLRAPKLEIPKPEAAEAKDAEDEDDEDDGDDGVFVLAAAEEPAVPADAS